MDNKSFYKIQNKRIKFLKENSNKSYAIIKGNNNLLISAPHGVMQTRNGFPKIAEIGSLATALFLQDKTNSFLIAKTRNDFDDVNFDEASSYKYEIQKLLSKENINFVIDIHGLAKNRPCDINLGTNIGNNISSDKIAFNKLVNILKTNNFIVSIDQPFMASGNTISAFSKRIKPNIFSVQIEINCSITNQKENFEKYKKLLFCLETWINKYSIK